MSTKRATVASTAYLERGVHDVELFGDSPDEQHGRVANESKLVSIVQCNRNENSSKVKYQKSFSKRTKVLKSCLPNENDPSPRATDLIACCPFATSLSSKICAFPHCHIPAQLSPTGNFNTRMIPFFFFKGMKHQFFKALLFSCRGFVFGKTKGYICINCISRIVFLDSEGE